MYKRGRSKKLASLAEVMPGVLRHLNLGQVIEGQKVVEKWQEVAGREISQHTRALEFDKGVLLVSVDNTGWMNQLAFLKPKLLDKYAKLVRRGLVRDVRFVLARGRGSFQG